VILKCAATLDGRIATRSGDSKWITGESAREFVHRLRHAMDGILVGVGTVKMDNPSLTTRIKEGNGLDPVRIILDTHLSIPLDTKVLLQESDADTLIVTAESAPESQKEAARQAGARVITCPLKDECIDLQTLMYKFGGMGLTSILIEGGSRVIASALKAGIVDKILFFYAPKILGGDDGIPICRGPGPELMKDSLAVTDINFHRFDDDILIEGYIEKS
jgi:diaminohydroxyphosphoribosylaminopyrimidine deaminase/5-amino-6-(5-phosphoribosylamino)uracil reductase